MDKQRLFLMVSLALITYLLILAWNKDYGQATAPAVPSAVSAQPKSTQDVPQTSVTTTQSSATDIPSHTQPALEAPTTKMVLVKTNTLIIKINLVGGDIERVELPKYPAQKKEPNKPFVLLNNINGNTYIAQSGLVGTNGPDAAPTGRPTYQAAAEQYELKNGEKTLSVALTYSDKSTTIIKEFIFERDSYVVKVNHHIENKMPVVWQGALFGQIKRDGGDDPSASGATTASTYIGSAFKTNDSLYKKVSFKDISKSEFKENVADGWVAMLQHYFVSAWVPTPKEVNTFTARYQTEGPFYIVGFTGPFVNVAPNSKQTVSATFYAGPKIQSELKKLSPGLELTVDYGMLWWLAQPIFWLMTHIQKIIGNWGFTIIVLTLIVKLLLFNLSAAGYRSMAKMRRVAPDLQRIKELYGDDRQKMSQAMMDLYRKEKINPLGGCLPILIQIPVFLALYWVLLESVELRQAPFVLWINDLSAKDPFFILPLLMGVSMYIQQQLSPMPPDPVQARVMKMMPVIFTFFFLWFPSGLVLYWVVSNTLSILQQWVITRHIEAGTK